MAWTEAGSCLHLPTKSWIPCVLNCLAVRSLCNEATFQEFDHETLHLLLRPVLGLQTGLESTILYSSSYVVRKLTAIYRLPEHPLQILELKVRSDLQA